MQQTVNLVLDSIQMSIKQEKTVVAKEKPYGKAMIEKLLLYS